jgi:hypothetical protein
MLPEAPDKAAATHFSFCSTTVWSCLLTLICLAVPCPPAVGETGDPLMHALAQPTSRPAGAPTYSDVCLSSRWKHPANAQDPHDSFETAEAFHATRFDWAYILDPEFVKRAQEQGMDFFGTVNTSGKLAQPEHPYPTGTIRDLAGEPVAAPWMRMWKNPAWGCVNHPAYRSGYLKRMKRYADIGADGLQMDDPGCNWSAVQWGGCFCEHCVAGFRDYLQTALTIHEQRAIGIDEIDRFDYRTWLKSRGGPIGDAYGKWQGTKLKTFFVEFQKVSVARFYEQMRAQLNEHAGRYVPMSSNNYGGRWSFPYHLFDYGVAELNERAANPEGIHKGLADARELGKAQVFTFVSEDVAHTRRVIAQCYGCGGHLIVPWDVYLRSTPEGSDRYFGKADDFADLYAFVRQHKQLFDGYELAYAAGGGISPTQHVNAPPIELNGNDQLCAVVRARPGNADAPVVVHLIDWSEHPAPGKVMIRPSAFFADGHAQATVWLPGSDKPAAKVDLSNNVSEVAIPALQPWSMIVISRAEGSNDSAATRPGS